MKFDVAGKEKMFLAMNFNAYGNESSCVWQ
jgi:hypothetical protein